MRNTGSKYDLASKDDLEALSREFEQAMQSFGLRLTQAEGRVVDEMHLRVAADAKIERRVHEEQLMTRAADQTLLDSHRDFIAETNENFVALAAANIRLGVALDLRLRDLERRTFTARCVRMWRALQGMLPWKRNGSPPSSSATSSSSSSSIPPRTDLDIDAAWKGPSEQYPIF